jgi:hypothetical protein
MTLSSNLDRSFGLSSSRREASSLDQSLSLAIKSGYQKTRATTEFAAAIKIHITSKKSKHVLCNSTRTNSKHGSNQTFV